jgi:hypothetical protein
VKLKNLHGDSVSRLSKTFTPSLSFSKVFGNLIDNKLFTIGDEYSYIDSLTKSGVTLNNPCRNIDDCADQPYVFEIKAGDAYRSFSLSGLDYYKANPL